ncbi:MAG: hypothetical protein U5L09_00605, partial [Bacteroidales bacterium]|nr:hypothetical protein [Bacteroidales bacterium]
TSLKQADMKLLPDANGRKRVLRYMEKENMNKIFRERKQKTFNLFMLGREAEKDFYGQAMR